MGLRGKGGLLGALAVAMTVGVSAPASAATPAPVPCSAIGGGKYDCQFYVAGDGVSGGAPVQASDSSRVGYLNQGTNWVTCQAVGSTVISGPYENDWWAYTEADDGRWGWVNAVWAKGGDNDGEFEGVPACGGGVGLPPGGQVAPAPGAGSGGPGGSSTGSTITPPPAVPAPSPSPSPPPTALRHLRVAIELTWHVAAARTRVVRVGFLHLPARARISVACRGRRCQFRRRRMSPRAARRDLARDFLAGDVLRFTITTPGYVPEIAVVRFRSGHGPRGAIVSR